ncbi:G3BP-like protein isoform X2 [Canna indica]|uniref:G3BP-like protein isoform X2 n=1 Tax=Canna indica TaxID=4628 RepID=A0AAQ3KJN9_9LILI|nr:G3BP-like protein isoform X2 [Canna indica]
MCLPLAHTPYSPILSILIVQIDGQDRSQELPLKIALRSGPSGRSTRDKRSKENQREEKGFTLGGLCGHSGSGDRFIACALRATMASFFPGHVNANQVGTYFVCQYYQILQQQPELIHQFYTNLSSMVRSDGSATDSAQGMLQIHNLVMCLNFTGIEIKTAQFLESWNGGVIAMVSGYVQLKDYSVRRKFVQTFFLAPQEKGYFVLNDIFHFLEEEHAHQVPETVLVHDTLETNENTPRTLPEPVSDYAVEEQVQAPDFVSPVDTEENNTGDIFVTSEPPQEVPVSDERRVESPPEQPTVTYPSAANNLGDPSPAPAEEPGVEPEKQTYASILRAKGQSGQAAGARPASLTKNTPVAADCHHNPPPIFQQIQSSLGTEKSSLEPVEEAIPVEDEGEEKSVYVGNLPSSISTFDLEQEFKIFGKLKPDGVSIRSRKEAGVFYAFIEFEDAIGVQNALKASPIQLNGRMIHVEERRPNNGATRGRRIRGRGGYQFEAPRGRFSGGRFFGRGMGQDNSDKDSNNRARGNGNIQRVPRQQRGILGS